MVGRRLTILFLGVLALTQAAYSEPKSLDIASVTVVKTGIYTGSKGTDKEAIKSCSTMTLSDSQAAAWFRRAKAVPRDGFQEQATITGCSSSGYLTTNEGNRYSWDLDIGGAGVIHLEAETGILCLLGPELSIHPR